ncbi:MAG: aldehyde ferredoxin oxidoreductase C-terminal domain-containing protein [Deferrisomatales bacterium]|nr:aldehyde ferredoxin oxidoreductase C-terminal domain-containing protein [Deferrisomatales bacterium]
MSHEPTAQLLSIDLTTQSSEVIDIPGKIIRQYIGGRGLGARLLYDRVPGGADPLGPDNQLIFTAGPLSGTGFYYSSKANLTTKSPLTGIYLYSICSGILAQEIRKSGFWAIAIGGIAQSPTYLVIRDGQVEFKDAAPLWGMETAAAQVKMLGNISPKKAAVLGIGPAGEQLVRSAALFGGAEGYRCFGRGGAGCVMGSKQLKGLVVAGSGTVRVLHQDRFDAARSEITRNLKTDWQQWADSWRRYETSADLETTNALGIIPTRNWQNGQFEGWRGIDKSTTPMGWPIQVTPCGPHCPTPGTRQVKVTKGPYQGAQSDVEWEATYAFGSQCGVDKMEAVLAASQLCDEYGVDNMTVGITIGFAMECFEKGLLGLEETDGIELRFGDDRAMIAVLRKMVDGEGFGKRLALGTRRLAQEIPGSEGFAMHAKGMEFGGYECRGLNGQALQFAVSARGGCHHAYGLPARAETLDGTRLALEGKGEQVKQAATGRILGDSLIMCTFPGPMYTREMLAQAASSMFEEPWSVAELNLAGERVMCQERLFNAREGLTREDDALPARLLIEPKPDGPTQGAVVPLEALKDDFYRAMGYDLKTGNPPEEVLERLGIER